MPKFHPRHSEPRAADTDSATIPVSSPQLSLSSPLLHYLCRHCRRRYYQFIIFAADRYCRLPLRYHHSLSLRLLFAIAATPFIIFSLPPAVIRLALIPPLVPLPPTVVAAATAAHYHCCRCREYNRRYRHRRYYLNTIATDVLQRNHSHH